MFCITLPSNALNACHPPVFVLSLLSGNMTTEGLQRSPMMARSSSHWIFSCHWSALWWVVVGSHGRPCHQNNFLITRGSYQLPKKVCQFLILLPKNLQKMLLLPLCDTNGNGGRVASGGGGSIASASSLLPHLTDLGTSGAAFPAAEVRQQQQVLSFCKFVWKCENNWVSTCRAGCAGDGSAVTP